MQEPPITLDGKSLSCKDVVKIARGFAKVKISKSALSELEKGRKSVERILKSGRTVYGINTGFGKLSESKVDAKEIDRLQLNLIRSHAVGVGNPLGKDEVRAVVAVRLNTLLRGNSGVRTVVANQLCDLLNGGVVPFIPRYGSLGASGDLAPSAHLALCLVGEGHTLDRRGKKVPSLTSLRKARISPISLKAKEGLAIINGTQVMTGLACLLIYDTRLLLSCLDIAAALSLEALGASVSPFDQRVHKLRPFKGQSRVALRMRELTKNSALVGSAGRVQDAYSLRYIPQVHGAFYDSLDHSESVVQVELNSVTDNPLIFPETDTVLSQGNFHGQPVSIALDLLSIIVAEASIFSERRIDKLLSGYNKALPMFLSGGEPSGLNSGLMVTQYTAAALASENKILAGPASLDAPTVSAGQEDHASMGVTAALKCRTILEHSFSVIAIEMLCAAQAIDLLGSRQLGHGTKLAYNEIRKISKRVSEDRPLSEDIENVAQALQHERIWKTNF